VVARGVYGILRRNACILVDLVGVHPIHMPMHTGIIPTFSGVGSFVLAASIFLFFAGMEMQAVHIGQLKNPSRDYPLSVLIATVVIVAFFILGGRWLSAL
jgi:amino acid transporter